MRVTIFQILEEYYFFTSGSKLTYSYAEAHAAHVGEIVGKYVFIIKINHGNND